MLHVCGSRCVFTKSLFMSLTDKTDFTQRACVDFQHDRALFWYLSNWNTSVTGREYLTVWLSLEQSQPRPWLFLWLNIYTHATVTESWLSKLSVLRLCESMNSLSEGYLSKQVINLTTYSFSSGMLTSSTHTDMMVRQTPTSCYFL